MLFVKEKGEPGQGSGSSLSVGPGVTSEVASCSCPGFRRRENKQQLAFSAFS